MLFKEGIAPKWEDAQNEKGGAWNVDIIDNRKGLHQQWQDSVLALIGGTYPHMENINGITSQTRRHNRDKLSVWTADAELAEENIAIGKFFKEVTGITDEINFESHADSATKSRSNPSSTAKYTV